MVRIGGAVLSGLAPVDPTAWQRPHFSCRMAFPCAASWLFDAGAFQAVVEVRSSTSATEIDPGNPFMACRRLCAGPPQWRRSGGRDAPPRPHYELQP